MAHHNSTPQSVLDAPVSQPVTVSAQTGPNRLSRRASGLRVVSNEPYTTAKVRKVRLGRKARWNR